MVSNTVLSRGSTLHAVPIPDDNRGALLDAGFPETVLALLEGYTAPIMSGHSEPLSISIPDLRIVKTAIGFLLNVSVGYGTYHCKILCSATTDGRRPREGSAGLY